MRGLAGQWRYRGHMKITGAMILMVLGAVGACGPATPAAHRPVDDSVAAQGGGTTGVGPVASSHGAARALSKSDAGGVLALRGDREDAMADAIAQMSDACGRDNYRIVSEGEAPASPDQVDGEAPVPTSSEWRVSYECLPKAP
jgi:hypothetical protein